MLHLEKHRLVIPIGWLCCDELDYGGKDSSVALIKLVMTDFNMILDTDWLAKHGAMIDCKERIVILGFEGEKPLYLLALCMDLVCL